MSGNPIQFDQQKTLNPRSVNFGTWTAMVVVGNALGMATFVGLAGLVLSIPARRLLMPYATLVPCGFVLAPLLYWARLARERPKSCSIRLGIAMFLYFQAVILALGLDTLRLGIVSQAAALDDYALFLIPFSALASVLGSVVVRQMLEAHRSG